MTADKQSHPAGLRVIILTHNEERDLPRCLSALKGWSCIAILDSGSVDCTVELAASSGAEVYTHPFSSFGRQRNWALENCVGEAEWVLFLDADEVATPAFRSAVDAAIRAAQDEVAGFYCCWKTIMGARWLKRCDAFPKWQFRLVRVGRGQFSDFGHGQKEGVVRGLLAFISEPYLHYAYGKGWSHWIERHNRYSTLEADTRRAVRGSWSEALRLKGSARNQALKPLLTRWALWPLVRFCADYFGRRGFLEGREGLTYCVNMAYYEFLIQLKIAESNRADQRPPKGRSRER